MLLAACLRRAALPPSYKSSLGLGAPASCHISQAAMSLWTEITERWWSEKDLN